MADVTIRTVHELGWPERRLLERLVRVLEQWQDVEVPAALHTVVEGLEQVTEAVADAQAPPQAP
jgi:hypothetical protein